MTHPSALTLDAFALGTMAAADAAALEAHLAVCARCRAEAAAAAAARAHFTGAILPRTLPAVTRRAGRWWRRRGLWPLLVPAAATAAVLLALVLPRSEEAPPGPEVAVKGGATLRVVARRGTAVFAVAPGATLTAGDQLRFVVDAAGLPYLLIASVDGAGEATIFHPYGGAASAPVAARPGLELPGSIVLDAAPGPERIYALFSRAPLAAAEVRAALRAVGAGGPARIRAAARLPVAAEEQVSVVIEKGSR